MFECRLVMMPLLQHSHWFLFVMDSHQGRMYILDPYVEEGMEENIKMKHLEEMDRIEEGFLKIHYSKKTGEIWQGMKKEVILPPSIPEQTDTWNCGLFLIMFAR